MSEEKEPKKGVIYISRIPPFMSVLKLRTYFSEFGEIGKIYLNQEDNGNRKKRLNNGGTHKILFTDGWIEFMRKSVAKKVARMLNNAPVGGPKRHNTWRDDLWNIKYLPKFQWVDLMEYIGHKYRERESRKTFKLMETRSELSHYKGQLHKCKKFETPDNTL